MNLKAFADKYQLVNWFKGTIFLLLGVLNSRFDVGFNWFVDNLIFGAIIYFLLVVSGMLLALYLKLPKENAGKKFDKTEMIKFISAGLYLAAYGFSAIVVFYFARNIMLLIALAIIGIIWAISFLYGDIWEEKSIIINLIIAIMVSFGLLFGALINDLSIPVFVYFFFLGAFTLQLSKDLLKSCKKKVKIRETTEEYKLLAEILTVKKSQTIILVLQGLTILFLVIPYFTGLYNYFLYLIPMLIATILIVISAIFNYIYDFETEYMGRVFILMRSGMFCLIVAYFFASI
ncbi:MAG: membrane protein of unknown function [Promethearchaeota archaeon]|nr:MAG: membrane protein of unknown function [Candidatus Lokiarchaeota archaeon]